MMKYINRKTGITVSVNSQLGGDWMLISAPPAVSIPEEKPEQKPEQKPEPQPEQVKTEKKKPAKKKAKTK